MNANECPYCGSEKWHYSSGVYDGEPLEPETGYCEECGFEYSQHVNDPLISQIERFREQEKR